MKTKTNSRLKGAFSVIELLVVIAVVGTIASMAILANNGIANLQSSPKPPLPTFTESNTKYTVSEIGESKHGQCFYRLKSSSGEHYSRVIGKAGHEKGKQVTVLIPTGLASEFWVIAD